METLDDLIKRREEHFNAYLQTNSRLEELLNAASPPVSPIRDVPGSPGSGSPTTAFRPGRHHSIGLDSVITSSASRVTGEDSDDEEDGEEYYVQTPLETQNYDHDGLRQHLRSFNFSSASRTLLHSVVDDVAFLNKPTLFPTHKGTATDRSHLSHHQVFDIGTDGAPLPVELPESERLPSNALVIWHALKEVNVTQPGDDSLERRAVGRIAIIMEPSPVLFGAIHYTMHQYFDVDELYGYLLSDKGSFATLERPFDGDERRRRSFVFNFEYMTLIGKDCQPYPWQLSDSQEERQPDHIPITRCSSVVALWLGGPPIKKLRNRSRRAKGTVHTHGFVYDPFGPWQILNVHCYPDWKSSDDVHDSTRHYVNGVEAFLCSLLREFADAEVRFEAIYEEITRLVTPPLDFMFNADVRARLLFEDAAFTYVRRYFWATQTLAIVKESIKNMLDAYQDNFTDEVWSGTHKTLWPLQEQQRPRNVYFMKKMSGLRAKFDQQIAKLKGLIREIDDRRDEIQSLREELFVGTSIQESRKSVENSEITVQQGHNIKILTMVSIFFLPLTFVTSVFGMTNMPTDEHYWQFGLVTACVCVPFFILVGSLNTTGGLHFWRHKVATTVKNFFLWIFCRAESTRVTGDQDSEPKFGPRTLTSRPTARSLTNTRPSRRQARHISMDSNRSSSRVSSENRKAGGNHPVPSTEKPLSEIAGMIKGDVQRRRTITYNPEVSRWPPDEADAVV